jgi:hypothetical protein
VMGWNASVEWFWKMFLKISQARRLRSIDHCGVQASQPRAAVPHEFLTVRVNWYPDTCLVQGHFFPRVKLPLCIEHSCTFTVSPQRLKADFFKEQYRRHKMPAPLSAGHSNAELLYKRFRAE